MRWARLPRSASGPWNETGRNVAAARAYLAGAGPFQHRAAIGTVVGGFLTDFYAMVAEWADRAECIVAA
jgi:PadR family transcriptional regulator AphA